MRRGHPCQRADFSHRRGGSERRAGLGDSVAEHETGRGYGGWFDRERRNAAQAASLPAGVETRCGTRANFARRGSGSVAAVLSHQAFVRHGGDVRMSEGASAKSRMTNLRIENKESKLNSPLTKIAPAVQEVFPSI